jgi:hypothetical protein
MFYGGPSATAPVAPPLKTLQCPARKKQKTDNNYVTFSGICFVVDTKHLFGRENFLFDNFLKLWNEQ